MHHKCDIIYLIEIYFAWSGVTLPLHFLETVQIQRFGVRPCISWTKSDMTVMHISECHTIRNPCILVYLVLHCPHIFFNGACKYHIHRHEQCVISYIRIANLLHDLYPWVPISDFGIKLQSNCKQCHSYIFMINNMIQ